MQQQKWTDEELNELESPDEWDWEGAVRMSPTGNPRAELAVPFSSVELVRLSEAAAQCGLSPIEYVRRAALEATDTWTTSPETR